MQRFASRSRLLPCAAIAAVLASGCNALMGYEVGEQQAAAGGASGGGTPTAVGAGGTGTGTPTGTGGTGVGGAAAGGAGGQGGAEPEVPCLGSPIDDFGDNSVDGNLWHIVAGAGVDVTEESEEIFVSLQPSATSYGTLNSVSSISLTNCSIWIETKEVLNSQVEAEAILEAMMDQNNRARIEAAPNDSISFSLEEDGAYVSHDSETYDGVQHRWWRIRERAGTIYFDTSPDGRIWTSRSNTPTPSFMLEVQMVFGAGYFGAVSSPGRARFDNANVTP